MREKRGIYRQAERVREKEGYIDKHRERRINRRTEREWEKKEGYIDKQREREKDK